MNHIETVFIQNIISPYRAHFFNKLNEYYEPFAVYYMGESEPGKFWDVSRIRMSYKYWVDRSGLFFSFSENVSLHFNPVLLFKLLKSKEVKNIILAVSWNDPTIFFILLMRKLCLTKKRVFFWAEANYLTNGSRRENRLKLSLKRFAFNCVDGALIIPGRMSILTFDKWGVNTEKLIFLPNVINNDGLFFCKKESIERERLPVFIMPMRIIESIKGGINFWESIGESNVKKAVFWVAGDGADMNLYEDYVLSHGYQNHIILKGFCQTNELNEMYNGAGAFLLPSFSDSSPLTLVEALNLHLPILCSNHCGNHFEAIEEGVNGYTFSPLDSDDIKNKYELFMSRYKDWKNMGKESSRIYQERFETNKVVSEFVRQFKEYKK